MNASSWHKLTELAIKRLARRRSEHLGVAFNGEHHGFWTTTYAIAPSPEIARAGADDLARYLRLAISSEPGNGRDARIEVSAGVEAAGRQFYFTEVGYVTKAELDATIDQAIRVALALTSFDLTDVARLAPGGYAFEPLM